MCAAVCVAALTFRTGRANSSVNNNDHQLYSERKSTCSYDEHHCSCYDQYELHQKGKQGGHVSHVRFLTHAPLETSTTLCCVSAGIEHSRSLDDANEGGLAVRLTKDAVLLCISSSSTVLRLHQSGGGEHHGTTKRTYPRNLVLRL